MLQKNTVLGSVTITESGHLEIRRDLVILDDGVEVLRRYARVVRAPGDDVSSDPILIQRIAALVWTPEILAAEAARRAARSVVQA